MAAVAGLAVALLVFSDSQISAADPLLTVLLLSCAVASELLPIPFRGTGLNITLSLPFLAGISFTWSPLGALLCEALLAGVIPILLAKGGVRWSRWADSIFVGLAAAGLAGIGLTLAPTWIRSDPLACATFYAAGFGALNILLIVVEGVRRPVLGLGAVSYAGNRVGLVVAGSVYLLCAAAVGVAIGQRQPLILLLLFVPFVELRRAIMLVVQQREQASETVAALMLMLRRAHPYSHGHLERVATMAERAALRLGMPGKQAHLVRVAALLHDIGKIAVDERILDKQSSLTPSEYDHVKLHASHGAAILGDCHRYADIVPWIKWHHERPDGRGYPDGLSGEEIPLPSRVIAVVDAFDAMVGGDDGAEQRPYRPPKTVTEALVELRQCAGTQFDPRVVAAFQTVLEEEGIV